MRLSVCVSVCQGECQSGNRDSWLAPAAPTSGRRRSPVPDGWRRTFFHRGWRWRWRELHLHARGGEMVVHSCASASVASLVRAPSQTEVEQTGRATVVVPAAPYSPPIRSVRASVHACMLTWPGLGGGDRRQADGNVTRDRQGPWCELIPFRWIHPPPAWRRPELRARRRETDLASLTVRANRCRCREKFRGKARATVSVSWRWWAHRHPGCFSLFLECCLLPLRLFTYECCMSTAHAVPILGSDTLRKY